MAVSETKTQKLKPITAILAILAIMAIVSGAFILTAYDYSS